MRNGAQKRLPLGVQYALVFAGAIALFGGIVRIWPYADEAGLSPTQTYHASSGSSAHGGVVAKTRCIACHGADGNSSNPAYPKLAGQSANFLYTQLLAFKTGDRSSPIMSGIAAGLSAQDAEDVATYYAAQTLHPDKITDQQLAARGEQVFYANTGPGMMSSCAACHDGSIQQRRHSMGMMSRGMMGMMTRSDNANAIPRLNGQHAAYLLDQLNRFASGDRPSGVMTPIAGQLNEADRRAVAEYLSGQP